LSLSICLVTNDPPARVAAVIDPLRPIADEVLLAADSRVSEQTLAGYQQLADRLFRIDFRFPERHLQWLYEQCRGDWILHMDSDEIASKAFVRRLPEMLSSREARHFWVPIAWLYPDAGHLLVGAPWSEGFVNRLTRNDATLRVNGTMHTHVEPVWPCEFVEEPIYHLDLLDNGELSRRDKALCYEVARPHLSAPGGERMNEAYYVPELHSDIEMREVPAEDREWIVRALQPPPLPTPGADPATTQAARSEVPMVTLRETDRRWEGRLVDESAYRATIEPWYAPVSLTPGERRQIFLRVRNDGTEHWPASLDARPAIRLGYRWLRRDGEVVSSEGPRSAFCRVVGPGQRILTPLHVDAPSEPGEYLLEVDVVHEHVQWFGCPCRVAALVEHAKGLPAPGMRLRPSDPPARQRWRRTRIPRTLHRVWLGETPMPPQLQGYGEMLAKLHPRWSMRLWTDADLMDLDITADERARSRSAAELSNLVRYEILHRFGGVYLDTDVECRRNLTPLLRGIDAFAALEIPGRVGSAVLGSVPHQPAFARAARLARRTLGTGEHSANANGPYLLSLVLEEEPGVAILGAEHFYPYLWKDAEPRDQSFPYAYAVHRWAGSWMNEEIAR
jgi:hypothetical protein